MVFVCPNCRHQKNSIDCYGCDPIEMRCCKCHSPLLSTSGSYRSASPASSIGSVDTGPSVPPRSGKSWPTNIFADFGESDKQEEVEKWQAGDGGSIRHSTSGSLHCLDDSVNSYNHYNALFAELGADFPIDETSGFRKPNLGDPVPSDCDGRQILSKQGMKRRALSPPAEVSREDKALLYTADAHQKQGASGNYLGSPISRQPSHGSVSSVSSASLRNNSYASSLGLSIAGSSVTSVSSPDTHSPRAISPLSEFGPPKDSPYITSVSLNPSQASIQSAVNQTKPSNASRIGGQYMFESEEELRAHEVGKQYKHTCTYSQCNKSFSHRTHLLIHIRSHSGEKPYLCSISSCGQRFSQLGNLKTHERRHRGEKPFSCEVPGCDKRFSQRSNLRSHCVSVHGLYGSSSHPYRKL